MPTKTDIAEVSSAAVSIIMYINSFKYPDSFKGGEDSDVMEGRTAIWVREEEGSDVREWRTVM